jgi:cyclin-dependent kinase 12/13
MQVRLKTFDLIDSMPALKGFGPEQAEAKIKLHGMDEFKKQKVIGEGTYGKVYLVKVPDPQFKEFNEVDYRAIKNLKLASENEGFPITAMREIQILKILSDHPNIVKLEQVITRGTASSAKPTQ